MAAMTDIFENKYLDWFFRAQALGLAGSTAGVGSGPATLYILLFTTNPTDSTAGVEVAGGSYARAAVVSSLANWAGTQGAGTTVASSGASGTTSNNGAITFPAPTAAWGVVTGFGIADSLTGGLTAFYGALTANKTVNSGDPAPFYPAGTLTVQVDN